MVERMLILSQRPEQTLIEEVALVKGINPSFVEKDWWVVQLVRVINRWSDSPFVFRGGQRRPVKLFRSG